ncbi:M56 family metallopeptidase [Saccharopolyspora taberi]|uniref:M56 family metallopeptidase n=1 Tax=Saccharopolyspora taberi TaxID=60895 RepID=A0ABN3VGT6_9PSEU
MIGALALLFGAALLAIVAPAVLRKLLEVRTDPQVVLVVWAVLVGATFLTTVGTLVIIVLPTHGPMLLLMRFAHNYANFDHGSFPIHELSGALLLIPVAVVSTLACRGLVRYTREQRRLHRRHLDLLRITASPETGSLTTMWLPASEPLAYSVAGTPSLVVATRGVREQLRSGDIAAVLEHERAHLRGRHHVLVGLAQALANSAPWVPLMRHSPSLVRAAVELAADRVAARSHGATAVRTALLTLTKHRGGPSAPANSLSMGEGNVGLRLSHLETSTLGSSPAKRALTSSIAALATTVVLTVAGTGLLFAAVTLFAGLPFAG